MINKFQGKYRFLSNFWPAQVFYLGVPYPAVENAYQAAKLPHGLSFTGYRKMTPGQAKRYSRKMPLREDWEQAKLEVMEELVRQKFEQADLAKLLQKTHLLELVEGNYWHDKFWGKCFCLACKGQGENYLGQILTKIREGR